MSRVLWLALIVVLVSLARFILITSLPVWPDEAIYALVAERTPTHFYTHPPGIALLIHAGMEALGKTAFGIRLPSLLLMTLALLPIYGLAREIGGKRVACWSVAVVALVPIYLVFGASATPDAAQFFCWASALYCTFKALRLGFIRWWLAAGGTVCLGLFVKYTFVLYFPSLLLCLFLSPQWRAHWKSPGLYLGAAIPLLGFVPLALWRLTAGGENALKYHLAGRHLWQWPQWQDVLIYQAAHTFYISTCFYLLSLIAMGWALYQGIRHEKHELVFLGSFAVVTYGVFLVMTALTARTLHREHWDALAYLPALIAAVLMIEQWIGSTSRREKWSKAIIAFIFAPAVLGLVLLPIEASSHSISRLTKTPPWFATMLGWEEMALAVDQYARKMPSSTPLIVYCQSGQSAVEYAFYGQSTPAVFTADSRWNRQMGIEPLFQHINLSEDSLPARGQNAIAVGGPYASATELADWETQLHRRFKRVVPLPDLHIRENDKTIKTFRFHQCFGLIKTVP